MQERIRKSEALTAQNTGLTLNIAANYGGRWDIVRGVRQLAQQVQEGLLRPEQIDEEMLGQQICMHELAPVDLVIRTGENIELVIFCCGKLPMPNFTLRMFSGPISMNKTLKVRCMPLLIESVVSAAPSPVMKSLMGVAFAEVSPDFCFCFNTRCHRGVVLLPPVGSPLLRWLSVCWPPEWGQLSGFTTRTQRVWLAVLCGLLLALMLFYCQNTIAIFISRWLKYRYGRRWVGGSSRCYWYCFTRVLRRSGVIPKHYA